MYRFLLFFIIWGLVTMQGFSQCNQTTNITYSVVSNSCPAGTVTYNLVFSSAVPNGNNSICYGYTINSPGGGQQTTNIGPVNQSNSMNSNWSHSFNVTIYCDQSLTLFLNAWSNQNCGGMMCASPRSRTILINALPVDYTRIIGYDDGENNEIQWQTAQEINNEGYFVLHSTDGVHFDELNFVKGKGWSDEIQNYQYTHRNVTGTTHYYQLKQLDFDGRENYSQIITVIKNAKEGTKNFLIRNDELEIYVSESTFTEVFNAMGKVMESRKIDEGVTSISMLHWPSGVYFIREGSNRPVSFFKP